MKIELDIDYEKSERTLTKREKWAIHILLVVFYLVVPTKYPHQVKEIFKDFLQD